jgi:hypothetical protein
VDYERGLAGRIATRLPVDAVALAHVEHPMGIRFDLGIEIRRP